MNKLTLLAALGAAGTAAAITALPAGGHADPSTRTIGLTGKQRVADQRTIDVAPRGESVGDRLLSSETLRRGRAPVARVESECVLLDATYEGAQCTFTMMFRDGVLIAQGASVSKHVPGVDATDEDFVILGGTGRFARASGSVSVDSTRNGDRVTIRIASPGRAS